MHRPHFTFVLAVLCLCVFVVITEAKVTRIVSGTEWLDTNGNRIEAHGAGMRKDPLSDGWLWYGENKKTAELITHGVNAYYSSDLLDWTFLGEVFNQANVTFSSGNTVGPVTIERPKVLWNAPSRMFVLWMHIDPNSYSLRQVAVAVSPTASGPFHFVRAFQPDSLPSLDMSVFEDTDENGNFIAAYFVRSVDNSYVGISKISDDMLDTRGLTSIIPTPREGHAIFKYADFYYMLTSHLTGWSSNPLEAWRTNKPQLEGAEWISLGNPTHSATTFDSQSSFVLPWRSADNSSYFIMMNDHWSYPNLLNASYIWLPFQINAKEMEFNISWRDSWSLDSPFASSLLPKHVSVSFN